MILQKERALLTYWVVTIRSFAALMDYSFVLQNRYLLRPFNASLIQKYVDRMFPPSGDTDLL